MTRAELHNVVGFHPASLISTAAHLRKEMKRKRQGTDATALINHEGWMNGYLDALDALEAAASPHIEEAKKSILQPYSQPENQNPNRK